MNISVVIPAHNEEGNIVGVIEKVEGSLTMPHELIVVDDHSTDRTADLVKGLCRQHPAVRLINNPYKKGFAGALKAGFAQANNELIVPVMGDLCDDLSTIEKMARKMEEGYDVVCGSRYIKGGVRVGGSRLKGFFSFFAGWSLFYLLGIPTHDIANAFKMYRKRVLDSINIEAEGFVISMELPLKAYYSGFRITEIPTAWKEREQGKSSFKMLKVFPEYLKFYLWGIGRRFLNNGGRKK